MRLPTGLWAILALSLLFGLGGSSRAAPRAASVAFVTDGQAAALDDYFRLGSITQGNGCVAIRSATTQEAAAFRQHTASTFILAGKAIEDGDFDVSARLRLVRQDARTTPLLLSLVIGNHYYDFGLDDRTITYAGRVLDAVTYEAAAAATAIDLPDGDEPVSLEVIRRQQAVTVQIQGKLAATLRAVPFVHGDIAVEVCSPQAEKGLDPSLTGPTALRVWDYRASGNLVDRTAVENDWRQRVVPEYRQVRRIGGAMAYVPDDPKLPKVLLIGDSISFYYTDPVRAALAGKANIHRIGDNATTTTHGLQDVRKWLHGETWDVIHFNFGLHDITRTSPEDYRRNLEQLVQILQPSCRQLIWATITPVPEETKLITPAKVQEYNRIAREVMDAHHIPIDDLYAHMLGHSDEYKLRPGNEHFNTDGSAFLAKQVARSIEANLPGAPGK